MKITYDLFDTASETPKNVFLFKENVNNKEK